MSKLVKLCDEDVMTGIEIARERAGNPKKSMRTYAEATVDYLHRDLGDTEVSVNDRETEVYTTEMLLNMGAVEGVGEGMTKGLAVGAGIVGLAWLGTHLYKKYKERKNTKSEFEKLYKEHVEKYGE